MEPYLRDGSVTLFHGDCLDVLRSLPDCSVDSVVCDPPYGLANTDPAQVADTIIRWVNGERDYLPGGKGFMGKAWDAFVPPVAVWDDCLRVLKPGGHVLAFAGSRTMDLMTLSLRLAGFEIRDSIAWLYGSGFPKSLDVSKAIDKAAPRAGMFDAFAEHFRDRRAASGLTQKDIAKHFPSKTGGMTGCVWNWENSANVPTPAQWEVLAPMLGLSDEWLPLIERVEAEREVIAKRKAADRRGDGTVVGLGHSGSADITAPATPAAEQWQGWGTALKPAFEPVVVARKPLAGTVAANVLAHGVGALNIDACRVGYTSETDKASARPGGKSTSLNGALAGKAQTCETQITAAQMTDTFTTSATGSARSVTSQSSLRTEFQSRQPTAGRWPANVVLDESQAATLDEQSGNRPGDSPTRKPRRNTAEAHNRTSSMGAATSDWVTTGHSDVGGASRFFYVAKASTRERPKVDGVAHPTVKPLTLMRWLVRLVTPPGGTVLEPFAGSGTTVEAAILEGFHCVAIEREADYLPLIEARLARVAGTVEAEPAAPSLFDMEETA